MTVKSEKPRSFDEAAEAVTRLRQRMRDRIVRDPEQMNGTPCVRSVRTPVSTIVQFIADGYSRETLVKAMPGLSAEDIDAALWFAASAVQRHCDDGCTGGAPNSHA